MTPPEAALNVLLSQYQYGYRVAGVCGQRIVTRFDTNQQFGTIGLYTRATHLRPQSTLHVPGEKAKSGSFEMSLTSYQCVGYQHGQTITAELMDGVEIDTLMRATDRVSDALALDFELRVRDRCFTSVDSTLTLTGAGAFTAPLSSYVGSAAAWAHAAIVAQTGLTGTHVVMPQATYSVLLNHPEVVKHGTGANAHERLASIFQVEPANLLVPTCVFNAANEGQAPAYAPVWSSCILVAHVADAPSAMTPTFLAHIFWHGPRIGPSMPAGGVPIQAKRDDENFTWRVFGRYYSDERVACPELGALIQTGI